MEESKTTKTVTNKSGGNDKAKLEQGRKYKQSVLLKHRANRACEYRMNHTYERFNAYEVREFDEKILEDKNFKKQSKYFTIQKKRTGGK